MKCTKLKNVVSEFGKNLKYQLTESELSDVLQEIGPVDWNEFNTLIMLSLAHRDNLDDSKFRNFSQVTYNSRIDTPTLKISMVIYVLHSVSIDSFYVSSDPVFNNSFTSYLLSYIEDLNINLSDEKAHEYYLQDVARYDALYGDCTTPEERAQRLRSILRDEIDLDELLG